MDNCLSGISQRFVFSFLLCAMKENLCNLCHLNSTKVFVCNSIFVVLASNICFWISSHLFSKIYSPSSTLSELKHETMKENSGEKIKNSLFLVYDFRSKLFFSLVFLKLCQMLFACRCFRTSFLLRQNHFFAVWRRWIYNLSHHCSLSFPSLTLHRLFIAIFIENRQKGGVSNWNWKGILISSDFTCLCSEIENTCSNQESGLQFIYMMFWSMKLTWLIRRSLQDEILPRILRFHLAAFQQSAEKLLDP